MQDLCFAATGVSPAWSRLCTYIHTCTHAHKHTSAASSCLIHPICIEYMDQHMILWWQSASSTWTNMWSYDDNLHRVHGPTCDLMITICIEYMDQHVILWWQSASSTWTNMWSYDDNLHRVHGPTCDLMKSMGLYESNVQCDVMPQFYDIHIVISLRRAPKQEQLYIAQFCMRTNQQGCSMYASSKLKLWN